jgi:hypothetical protein
MWPCSYFGGVIDEDRFKDSKLHGRLAVWFACDWNCDGTRERPIAESGSK